MKPNGIKFEISGGCPRERVTPTTDAVWAAIKKAREAGWSVEQFRSECAEAWAQSQREEMRSDEKAWR